MQNLFAARLETVSLHRVGDMMELIGFCIEGS